MRFFRVPVKMRKLLVTVLGMEISVHNYVRTLRKAAGLTQGELAFLINQRSENAVRLFEIGDRVPLLEGALALQIVFGVELKAIFPGYYEQVEDAVMRRGRLLDEQLEDKTDSRSTAVRALLSRMVHGAQGNDIIL